MTRATWPGQGRRHRGSPGHCRFVGGVLGGVVSDFLLQRGVGLSPRAKFPSWPGWWSAAPSSVQLYRQPALMLTFMSVAFFGKGVAALGWAVMSDVAPREATGLAGSLFNLFGDSAESSHRRDRLHPAGYHNSCDLALVFVFAHSHCRVGQLCVIAGEMKPSTRGGLRWQ